MKNLHRFLSWRRRPPKIYSDNFLTFVAEKSLQEKNIQDILAKYHVKWQFNLSHAP